MRDDPDSGAAGSIERTLAGAARLGIVEVMREAWERTHGIRTIVVGGLLVVYGALVLATWVLGTIFGAGSESLVGGTITQLVMMVIVYPFAAGVFMLGLRRSAGLPVRFADQFSYYRDLLPLVAVGALQSLVTFIGFMLLVVPGIYLTIALVLAVPLKVERDLPIVDCLIMSARLVNRKFFEVTVLSLAAIALTVLGALTLIGWIWTVPWTLMMFAIIYRQLAGFAPDRPAPGASGRLEV